MIVSSERKALMEHIEKYLGTIQRGWRRSPSGEAMDFQIVECLGGQVGKARAFCTLGLSDYPLSSKTSKKMIRHELLILAPESFGDLNIPALLQQLASEVRGRGHAYLRGEVVERKNPVFSGKPFVGFYAAMPVILPDAFGSVTDESGNQIAFVWMVPITRSEASLVHARGWNKFEDFLVTQNPDLVDLDRKSLAQEASHN